MSCVRIIPFLSCVCLLAMTANSVSQEATKSTAATVTAKTGLAQIEVTVPAVFVAGKTTELSVSPKTTQTFQVVKALRHGTAVTAGQEVVKFETRSYDDQVTDQEHALVTARVAVEEGERDLHLLELQNPLDVEQAELTWKQAQEDRAYFVDVLQQLAYKNNEQSLKSSKDFLDYNHEELIQLEKMYKADDLTEESEEIVLRRARDDYERQKFNFDRTKLANEREKNVGLPRIEKQNSNAHRLAEIAYKRSKLTLPLAVEKKRQELTRLRRALEKSERTVAELKADANWFSVMAPHDGVVYYGRANGGKWDGIADYKTKLRPFGAVAANDVFMTIVDSQGLTLAANIPEAESGKVQVGTTGRATPTAFPKSRANVELREFAAHPVSDGSFEAKFSVVITEKSKLVAGMNASIKLIPYSNAKAVLIPSKSVFTDEVDDAIRYVFFYREDGKHVRTNVVTGAVMGDQTEITSGVKEGDLVLADKPAS